MSLADIVGLAGKIVGMPGMDLAVSAVFQLVQTAQNVKVYRAQCQNLGARCTNLLLSYYEKSKGLEGTDMMESVDEITAVVENCQRKVNNWASMNWSKSFLHQGDIKQSLDFMNKEIDDCSHKFNIASGTSLRRGNIEMQAIHERDASEQRELLHRVLRAVDDLKETIANEPSAARPIMQAIQEELQGTVRPDEQRDLQQSMYTLHLQTDTLPPLVNLTGQVEKISSVPIYGAYNDVYLGLWLGEDEVALKFARAINQTPSARKRFQTEVEIWRDLQHRHVDRLFGIAFFDNQIYTVSPWMKNGSALKYINSTEEIIDRMIILGDVASGMEYLHARHIVHGDLRAANVLISDDGRACISDFGLSSLIEVEDPEESPSSHHGDRPFRWQAPEIVTAGEIVHFSTHTDVWSYGMVCLEILTGKQPYSECVRDAHVIQYLTNYRLPSRPTEDIVFSRGLDDQMWKVMLFCWSREPKDRPSMAEVKRDVRALQAKRLQLRPVLNGPLTNSPGHITKDLPGTGGIRQDISTSSSGPSMFPPSVTLSTSAGNVSNSISPPEPVNRRSSTSTTSSNPSFIGGVLISSSRTTGTGMLLPTRSPGFDPAKSPSLGQIPNTNGSLDLIFDFENPSTHAEDSRQMRSRERAKVQQFDREDLSLPPNQPSLLSRTRPTQTLNADSASSRGGVGLHLHSDSSSSEGLMKQYDEGISVSPPSRSSLHSRRDREASFSSASSYQPAFRYQQRESQQLSPLGQPAYDAKINIDSRTGKVISGNLEGLIERLVKKDRDVEFQEIFLTTFRLFSSASEMLNVLIRLYNTNPESRSDRVERRFMVLNTILRLLKGHYAKALEVSVLEDLRPFLQEVKAPFAVVATEAIKLIDELISRTDELDSPLSSMSPLSPRRASRASEVKPDGLAMALLFLESEKYNAITPTDCVSNLLTESQGGSNEVTEASETHNKIVHWVKSAVIKSSRKDVRADTLTFFIRAAMECRKLYNYSSAFAIVTALDSPFITRLSQTRQSVKKELLDELKNLSSLTDISHNHKAYRDTLPNATERQCLPILAVHLREIRSKYSNTKRSGAGSELLIDFERYAAIYEAIRQMLAYQSPSRGMYRSALASRGEHRLPALLYLEEQLGRTILGRTEEERLERRSVELSRLEAREREEYNRQLVESTGFDPA